MRDPKLRLGQSSIRWLAGSLSFLIIGCAELQMPTPKEVVTHPFGNPTIRGWSKEEVLAKWGEPDERVSLEPDKWGSSREEWIYQGRYPNVPVDYKYISKTKHFYFTGNVLVEMKSEEEKTAKAALPELEKNDGEK